MKQLDNDNSDGCNGGGDDDGDDRCHGDIVDDDDDKTGTVLTVEQRMATCGKRKS